MKNLDTTINKKATVGTKKGKVFVIDFQLPFDINKTSSKINNKISSVTIKPKRNGCSGCGRRRG